MTSNCFDGSVNTRAKRGSGDDRGRRGKLRVWVSCLVASPLLVSIIEPAAAQNIMAYPSRGQSQEQQQRDRFECYNWAEQQTGFNPQAQAGSTAAPPKGGPLRRHEMEKEEAQA